jgi:GntR family transcriptional regulator
MKQRSKPAFRHEMIAKQIVEDIQSGVYPVGTQLPPELELCQLLKASRHTVRQALSTLSKRGLIVRRASTGSMIISSHEPRILVQSSEPMSRTLAGPSNLKRTIVARDHIDVDAALADIIQCGLGEPWFRLKTINHSKETGALVSAAEIYIPSEYAGIVSHPEHERMRISDQVLSMYDEIIDKVEVEVVAGPLLFGPAAMLQQPVGSIGLAVIRRYTGRSEKLFEVSVTYHAQERRVFLVELRGQPHSVINSMVEKDRKT